MKKLSVIRLTEITLASVTVLLLLIFFILVSKANKMQKAAETQLLTAIDNAVSVCTSYSQYIEIPENLQADLDIYSERIAGAKSVTQKAYMTNIMLTYTQNRVNMNDPQSLYELASELGNSYDLDPMEANAYKSYSEKITAAFDEFKAADSKYKSISQK